jgi:hypothetical protein
VAAGKLEKPSALVCICRMGLTGSHLPVLQWDRDRWNAVIIIVVVTSRMQKKMTSAVWCLSILCPTPNPIKSRFL